MTRRKWMLNAAGLLVPFVAATIIRAASIIPQTPARGIISGYLLQENFEGTGYENSWTEAGGTTLDEDYTGVVLAGSQSMRVELVATSGNTLGPTFAGQSDCWAYLLIRPVVLPSATAEIFGLRNAGGTECMRVRMTTGGALSVRAGGGTDGTTANSMSTGTTYHVWIHYTKGSGADAFASVAFSTDGVKPTAGGNYRESTNGTATTDATAFRLGTGASATYEFIADKVRVSSTIGDNPS